MPIRSALLAGVLAAIGAAMAPGVAPAADLAVPPIRAAHWCGACGCLHVTHVRHRELRSTYGIAFDPRNYDSTEPHYYFGPVRAYPRYWVTADVQ